jgi:hypothetical protein
VGDIGTCVQCLADEDCPGSGAGVAACDLDALLCRPLCADSPAFCTDLLGGVCDENGLCVGCLEDEDCAEGESCDQASASCVAPVVEAPLCALCDASTVCAGNGLCVDIPIGPGPFSVESACGIDCSVDGECPGAFRCAFVGGDVVVGQQCVPDNSINPYPSCSAYTDLVEGAPCGLLGCGAVLVEDAVCIDDGEAGTCSIPCGEGDDCPEAYVCTSVAPGDTLACVPLE